MAYDEHLADRVRDVLDAEPGFSERKMLGGIAFMLDGHMCCGVVDRELMLRLGPDGAHAGRSSTLTSARWTSRAGRFRAWSTSRRRGSGGTRGCRRGSCRRPRSPAACRRSKAWGERVRVNLVVAAAAAVFTCAIFPTPGSSASEGRLAGATQITYGCPGPAQEGAPPCEHWLILPRARFTIMGLGATGSPILATKRRVVSDTRGRFTLVLATGRYVLSPLPQAHTHGGSPIRVSVKPGRTTWALVRFQGFPQMA